MQADHNDRSVAAAIFANGTHFVDTPRIIIIIIIIIQYHYDDLLERLNLLTLHNRRHHFDALLVINVSVCPL
jgi:hypothetical protein